MSEQLAGVLMVMVLIGINNIEFKKEICYVVVAW